MIEIPGYNILGQIGRGGMATVYKARQVLLDRDVALKVMSSQLASDPVYSQRFLQEARMLAALNHPHIVQVYDIGETPGGLNYFSMQLLTGGDFAERLRDGMSETELVRVLVAVSQALGFAHARGYVHRDVTPANILFDSHDLPVLTDFGIARALAATSRITSAGLSIGTSQYMSPEQARGAEVDHRSDIYSLGVLSFEAVAGHPPFHGDDGFAVAFSHVHDPVPRLPVEAERWQPLIDRAMAKNPDDRFEDCQAFIEGLRDVAPEEFAASVVTSAPAAGGSAARAAPKTDKPVAAAAVGASASPAGAASKRPSLPWLPLALAAGAVLSGAVLAFGLWSWMQGDEPETSKQVTTASTAKSAAANSPVAPQPVESQVTPEGEEQTSAAETATAGAEGEVPKEPHTVIDPVRQLLTMARVNLQQGRLTLPKPNNALDRFNLVLLIEKGNADAHQGIADVANAFLDLADKADVETDTAAWLKYLDQSKDIASTSQAGKPVLDAIRERRRNQTRRFVERGEQALLDWKGEPAAAAFSLALQISSNNAQAQRGLKQAQQLGKVGYVFSDRWDGNEGPSLVVVSDNLAFGRHEVTVAEFERFWNATGKSQFGSKMPDCRDQEATGFGAIFSGNKGSWQDPQFNPQSKQSPQHPVVCISYPMAEAYTKWLAQSSGRRYRLPSSAELMPHVRGGEPCSSNLRDVAFQREYRKSRQAVQCNDGFAATAPVGSFAARGPGLFDADGNVREWTVDCAASNCRERYAVGLSWETSKLSETRKDFPADTGSNTIGFRVVREID